MDGSKRVRAPFSARPAGILALLLIILASVAACVTPAVAKERRAEVTYSVGLKAPADAKLVRLWLPYPMSDENQEVADVVVTGNPTSSGVYREGAWSSTRPSPGNRSTTSCTRMQRRTGSPLTRISSVSTWGTRSRSGKFDRGPWIDDPAVRKRYTDPSSGRVRLRIRPDNDPGGASA